MQENKKMETSEQLVNSMTVQLRVRTYRMAVTYTNERALPLMEEHATRLLMILGEVDAGELQEFFGLTGDEREVLLDNLLSLELAELDDRGFLVPGQRVRKLGANARDQELTLTKLEDRDEVVTLELNTKAILQSGRRPHYCKGLREIEVAGAKMPSQQEVFNAFSRQYRDYLREKGREREAGTASIYKLEHLQALSPGLVAVDLDFTLEPRERQAPLIRRRVCSSTDSNLAKVVESQLAPVISDSLQGLTRAKADLSFGDFCRWANDPVLPRYMLDDHPCSMDLSRYFIDKSNRQTGYKENNETIGLVGPVYLENNCKTILRHLDRIQREREEESDETPLLSYWRPSGVPLWGESGESLNHFFRKVNDRLALSDGDSSNGKKGGLLTLFPCQEKREADLLWSRFRSRVPHCAYLYGAPECDHREVLLFGDKLAVVQYNVEVDGIDGITLPIGYLTTNPERIDKIASEMVHWMNLAHSMHQGWSMQKEQFWESMPEPEAYLDQPVPYDGAPVRAIKTEKMRQETSGTRGTLRLRKPC